MEDYLIKVAELVPENLRNTEVFLNIIDIFSSLISEEYDTAKTIKEAMDDLHYYNSDYTKLSYNVKIQKIKDLGFSYLLDVFELSDLELSNLLTFFTVIKAFKCRTEGFKLILDVFKVPYEYHTWDEVEPHEEMFTATLKLNLTPDSGNLTELAKKLMVLARNYTAPLTYVTIDLVEEIGYQNTYYSAGVNHSIVYDTFEITSDTYVDDSTDFQITIDTRLAYPENDPECVRFYYPLASSNYGNPVVIDWGDGIKETLSGGIYPYHDYQEPGVYSIKLKLLSENAATPRIYSAMEATDVSIRQSARKIISLDTPIKNYGSSSLYRAFYANSNLTSIHEDLFKGCSSVTDFRECFKDSGITELPQGLLSSCIALKNIQGMFYNTAITSIPENFFKNNKNISGIVNPFAYCRKLESIPADLYLIFENATSVDNCFNTCSSLNSIPSNLFSLGSKISDFSYAFFRCGALATIPEGLFSSNLKATNFSSTFRDCSSLGGKAPELWLTYPNARGRNCYENCLNLSNYNEIPDDWK